MTGVVAAALVAHVPTLGRSENTPDYQQTLVQAERTMGAAVRKALKPDLWVIVSTHWVSTFDWFATCQPKHEGLCVAQEAPNLIPGLPYSYRGDPEFGGALVDAWKQVGVAAVKNEAANYHWDYGTFVPLQYIDPSAEVPVVGLPVVLMADHGECLRAGAAVHETAKRQNKRVVFLASTALSHLLVRGRHKWPTPERVEARSSKPRSKNRRRRARGAKRSSPSSRKPNDGFEGRGCERPTRKDIVEANAQCRDGLDEKRSLAMPGATHSDARYRADPREVTACHPNKTSPTRLPRRKASSISAASTRWCA